MARRRASMREGPLAELFRATEAAQRQAEQGGATEQPPAQESLPETTPANEPEERTVEHIPSWEEASRAETPAPPAPRPDPMPGPPAPDPVPPTPTPAPDPEPPQIRHEPPPPRYEAPPPPRREPPPPQVQRAPEPPPVTRYAEQMPESPARLNRAYRPDSGAYLAVIKVIGV